MRKELLPSVSVVMTTYNGARYIKEQVDSILNQSFSDLELIVADDCSSDETFTILTDLAKQDERIRLFGASKNLGLHKNLERALKKARAPMIAISDQDDIWNLSKLACLLAHAGNVDAVYSNSLLVDSEGKSIGLTLMERIDMDCPLSGAVGGFSLLRNNFISGHALMFKRELLDKLLPFCDSSMFDQQIAFAAVYGRGIFYVDEPLVLHRIHGQNQVNACLALIDSKKSRHVNNAMDIVQRSAKRKKFVSGVRDILGRYRDGLDNKERSWSPLIERVVERMARFDDIFFDINIFLLLLMAKGDFFYPGENNIVRKCIKYSKGRRYYIWRYDKKK